MSPKPSKSVLAGLQSGEAVAVLRQLLAAHPELEDEAERIARSLLQAVDFMSVADAVEDEIRFLDYDDLNARAGHHERGYVEPGDAAMEILEEAIQPFIEDMTRHLDLGFEAEALEVCKGVILGLYRLDKGERCTLVEWAPDFPFECAAVALREWRDSVPNKRATFPDGFVAGFVPEWSAEIERILRQKKRGG